MRSGPTASHREWLNTEKGASQPVSWGVEIIRFLCGWLALEMEELEASPMCLAWRTGTSMASSSPEAERTVMLNMLANLFGQLVYVICSELMRGAVNTHCQDHRPVSVESQGSMSPRQKREIESREDTSCM